MLPWEPTTRGDGASPDNRLRVTVRAADTVAHEAPLRASKPGGAYGPIDFSVNGRSDAARWWNRLRAVWRPTFARAASA